ncbi:DNA-binding protein [Pseudomonas viridiflava]|uniref:DNA-binding protein n=1 Tax=Pseudomonas viridiflava TaxID=33069 RepID=UPI000F0937F9|nr:DNA-binding protein [Pseudomonas viridiflava]
MPAPLTPEQALAALDHQGISIAQFARLHTLNKNLVSDLLNGRKKGRRGEAHRAAVLLGITCAKPHRSRNPTAASRIGTICTSAGSSWRTSKSARND